MAIRRSKFRKPNGPTSKLAGDCGIDGCPRPMFRKGLCCAHFKRTQRRKTADGMTSSANASGGLVLAEILDPEEKVLKTGSELLETSAEDDELYKYRRRTFLRSCEAWLLARGWSPPARVPARRRMASS